MPDMHDPDRSPLNPLPFVVWMLAGPVAAIELLLSLADRGIIGGGLGFTWRVEAIQRFGFSGQIFDWMVANHFYPVEQMIRFVTYPFFHASFTHMMFVFVFILALGKMVGEVFSAAAVLTVFFASAIMGALVFGLMLDDPAWLVGGYPPVYGLIGAFTFLLWVRATGQGSGRLRAFGLIGTLLGIQLVFGALFGGSNEWVADLSGFATGFGLSFVVCPGGWRRALALIRQR